MSNWLLPEHLSDILPAQARRIEQCRRDLLDLYRSHGFEFVMPPLAEYIDSLLSGNGRALNLRTSKLVDQLSGRTMGVRADITPQIARIDAHLLNRPGVTRLCYCGPVLHARPAGLLAERELLQIGAEIFGHAGVEADIQIISLAMESMGRLGIDQARLDLNHPGIFRALIQADPALVPHADRISDLLASKDIPALEALGSQMPDAHPDSIQALLTLATLYGGVDTLERARRELPRPEGLIGALDALESLVMSLPAVDFTIDLADMGSGYGYHSGVVFSIYASAWHQALAKGGRYDGIGQAFGRARPATGFSLDLRKLADGLPEAPLAPAIRAPWKNDAALEQQVRTLRAAGEVVIQVLPSEAHDIDEFTIDRELVFHEGQWTVKAVQES
ncbi:MAG TPA: ATP phosphoribosyltransferase regulatory subunit [Burkholderiaceae bacterium]|nr:ATP phosphoribosyltransferase regulatory subunit [Burkholderiaceae bacterium]